jgi:tetratricopeptide (TPR) repeat protein
LLIGSGPETFSSAFPHSQSVALSRAYPAFYHESAHNIFLDALTAQGIIGLAALLAFVALGFYAARSSPILAAGLAAGIITHQFTVFTTPTALYLYLTIAMLIANAAPPLRSPTAVRRLWAVIPSATLAFFAIRLLLADHSLAQARAALQAGQPNAAANSYQRARNLGIHADLWYSREMAAAAVKTSDAVSALKAWQQALESGSSATSTADDPPNAWYNLAFLHARENEFDSTERSLRQAIANSPNWFKPHWMLAQILETKGRWQEAMAEATLAATLDGGKDAEVAQTVSRIQAKKE